MRTDTHKNLVAFLEQNFPTQGEITIDGNPMFAAGEVYTAITAALSDSNDIGGFTYQWLVSFDDGNNYNEIAGETGRNLHGEHGGFCGGESRTRRYFWALRLCIPIWTATHKRLRHFWNRIFRHKAILF